VGELSIIVVDAAFPFLKDLNPGLLESVHEAVFARASNAFLTTIRFASSRESYWYIEKSICCRAMQMCFALKQIDFVFSKSAEFHNKRVESSNKRFKSKTHLFRDADNRLCLSADLQDAMFICSVSKTIGRAFTTLVGTLLQTNKAILQTSKRVLQTSKIARRRISILFNKLISVSASLHKGSASLFCLFANVQSVSANLFCLSANCRTAMQVCFAFLQTSKTFPQICFASLQTAERFCKFVLSLRKHAGCSRPSSSSRHSRN
jgi:hypothetical protein